MSLAPQPTSRELYLRILRHTLHYKWVLAASFLGLIVMAATEAGLNMLLKPLIDNNLVPNGGREQAIWVIPAILVGLAVARFLASVVNAYAVSWLANRMQFDLRQQMFARLLTLPNGDFEKESGGVLMSRISYDVTGITRASTHVLTVSIRDTLLVIALLSWMLWLDWQLTLICFAVLPVVAFSIQKVGKRLRRLSLGGQDAMAELGGVLDEAIGGQRVVKIYGGQPYEQARFARVANRLRSAYIKIDLTTALNSGFVVLMVATTLAGIIYFASLRASAGLLTAGAFISFMTAMLQIQTPVKNLTKMNEELQRGLAAAQTVYGLIDRAGEVDEGKLTMDRPAGRLTLAGVAVRYGDSPTLALRDIDLDIAPGEVVALVGGSGSGKTTLAMLLPRFMDPSAGSIQLDGHDIRDYTLASLRRQIALVSQDVVLFNDTVTANIAYGDPAPDLARVHAAAQAAQAHDFITAMASGYETPIGENGARLSGGQRQRLAIARALYKDAPVLILDEATSALDTESERLVQSALETLMKGRTTLIIAHRLSTIEKANRILVMRQGEIVESGTHAALLAQQGAYTRLWQTQHG
ncbi:lipid A export permease/ATP-binding protein MsbA [Chitinimonas sp. BJYL2]|uniref:lipid A export permease/ATP-binding protein MsbA n=1 Tax=Chitinimonas sp. BJYL2 TaxID=2976696 RepID=UPI0022B2FA45|nr:lipid A export permease/ATP-binding protein MsbA [Chitinimonas sp. BJYL2]